MTTKLTLNVKKQIIESAKKRAKNNGISLSQIFEEVFQEGGPNQINTEPQRLRKSASIAREVTKYQVEG